MASRPALVALLLAIAGGAFWLAAAGPAYLLGVDAGNLGVAVLMACLWLALGLLSRVPVATLEGAASPAEWQAWLGVAFLGMAIAYFVMKLPLFVVAGPIGEHPEVARAGRNGVMLLLAWFVLSSVLGRRWRERVQRDERDHEIAARGCAWARGFMVAAVSVLAGTLALSPAERLGWATPVLLAQVLILAAMTSHWIELAVQAASYWRDRH